MCNLQTATNSQIPWNVYVCILCVGNVGMADHEVVYPPSGMCIS